MDYLEAELEARIFPFVDLDPEDWEEFVDEDLDIEEDEESPCPEGWDVID